MSGRFDPDAVLAGLTAFQRRTVDHVVDRLHDPDGSGRFLVADETGLGKSLVAKGVIARTIDRLRDDPMVDRIDIVYVCSSGDIASQNLQRLDLFGDRPHRHHASRLSLLARESSNLDGDPQPGVGKRVNLISFTPGTSFNLGGSFGQITERALLFVILRDELGLGEAEQRRAKLIFKGNAAVESLDWWIERLDWEFDPGDDDSGARLPDPAIVTPFIRACRKRRLLHRFRQQLEDLRWRRNLTDDDIAVNRELVGQLRAELAKAATEALEPDLIILDEFQRFRHLLDPDDQTYGEAAELAHSLFQYPAAKVLLLSATPYKPFTYAEELADGDDHLRDLEVVLDFLSDRNGDARRIVERLGDYRDAIVQSRPIDGIRSELETALTGLMCRTERPMLGHDDMLDERIATVDEIGPHDFTDYRTMVQLARTLGTRINIDYWKSTPYFFNFGDGYQVTDHLRAELKNGGSDGLLEVLAAARTIDADDVRQFRPLDPGNARMRRLVADTVDTGTWRLLWLPPSLPYEQLGGPYADLADQRPTKRLIFSSWAAVPTAISCLLSYEARRRLAEGDADRFDSADGRLKWDAMTTMSVFWPSPRSARSVDPIREVPPTDLAAPSSTAGASWYWTELFIRGGSVPIGLDPDGARQALGRHQDAAPSDNDERVADDGNAHVDRLAEHVGMVLSLDQRILPPSDERGAHRPDDLDQVLAHIARYAPGNIAYRVVDRLAGDTSRISEVTRWTAAARLSSALRSMFNRPETSLLFDQLLPKVPAWRAVLTYCRWGNLEAALDEYLHHLAGGRGLDELTESRLLEIVDGAAGAIAPLSSRYQAFDPHHPDQPIVFTSRFALRYGTKRGTLGTDKAEDRAADIQKAFNSPFWPFVLATTSVGQEGIDFHWWCRAAVHWNSPGNPVDFEQREGRVHRYGGLAIRQNIAAAHGDEIRAAVRTGQHPWEVAYRVAAEHLRRRGDVDFDGLKPHWISPGPAGIERHLYHYPLSRDRPRYERLKDDVALYRLTFGQPRQEDLLDLLHQRGVHRDRERAAELRLDLRPPAD